MKASEMWKLYMDKKTNKGAVGDETEAYDVWAFGAASDELAQLVLSGEKTATSSAYPLYESENEELPRTGEYSVIVNSKEEAVCVIKTTRVYVIPFNQVTQHHAYLEGEGDKTLDYWRNVHKVFFTECLGEAGIEFTDELLVVCEEFQVVYR